MAARGSAIKQSRGSGCLSGGATQAARCTTWRKQSEQSGARMWRCWTHGDGHTDAVPGVSENGRPGAITAIDEPDEVCFHVVRTESSLAACLIRALNHVPGGPWSRFPAESLPAVRSGAGGDYAQAPRRTCYIIGTRGQLPSPARLVMLAGHHDSSSYIISSIPRPSW